MAKRPLAKLPSQVYVVLGHFDNEPYLIAYERLNEVPDDEAGQVIGVYTLAEAGTVNVKREVTLK